MKKELKELSDSFERARKEKNEEERIKEGAAMERLMKNPDFHIYQRLMSDTLAQLVMRMRLVASEDLPAIQGALIQHDVITRLPGKVLEDATRFVTSRREEAKA